MLPTHHLTAVMLAVLVDKVKEGQVSPGQLAGHDVKFPARDATRNPDNAPAPEIPAGAGTPSKLNNRYE